MLTIGQIASLCFRFTRHACLLIFTGLIFLVCYRHQLAIFAAKLFFIIIFHNCSHIINGDYVCALGFYFPLLLLYGKRACNLILAPHYLHALFESWSRVLQPLHLDIKSDYSSENSKYLRFPISQCYSFYNVLFCAIITPVSKQILVSNGHGQFIEATQSSESIKFII